MKRWPLLLLLLPTLARATGETTGRVSGYVSDPTGMAVWGATLTLHGPALQRPMKRQSDENGRYVFENVPVGQKYIIDIELPGFEPQKRRAINVLLGQTTAVDIQLDLPTATAGETYEIKEQRTPAINPESARTGAEIGIEKATMLPLFQQAQGLPQLVAGVGPGNTPSSRGGLSRWGRFYVDGMDTSDVTDGSITAPLNWYAAQDFEIITGGFDAQYNAMGMVENMVTRTGSNDWTYDLSMTLSPAAFAAKNQVPSSQPSYVNDYTNNNLPLPDTSFYSPNVAVGGPLIRDRLWFYFSSQVNFSHREAPITTPVTPPEIRPTDTLTALARFKLTWQASAKDRVSLAFNFDHNTIDNVIGSASVTKAAESRIDRGGYFIIVNYDHYFTDNVWFQLQAGTTYKGADQDPQSGDYNAISHFDSAQNITQINAGRISFDQQGNWLHETKTRLQFDPTLNWIRGAHVLKGGIQTSVMLDEQTTGVSGFQRYTDFGGLCDPTMAPTFGFCSQRTDYYNARGQKAALVTDASALNLGFFLQDKWTLGRKLTLMPGFRVDIGQLHDDSGNTITTLIGLGPRLGVSYDPWGTRKGLLVAHYGRSNDVGNIFVAQHANPSLLQVISRFQTSTNTFPMCDPMNLGTGCSTAGGRAGRVFDSSSAPPHVDEFALGYHHEALPGLVLGADGTYRYYGNLWADEEINRIWDPTGTVITGYVNGMPQSIVRSHTPDSAYREYLGLDLWAQGEKGPWDVLASYTVEYNDGTVADYFDGYLANPRFTMFYDGVLADDRRHTLKGSLSYRTERGLDWGFRLTYRTGSPMWESFTNPGDPNQRAYRSPRGTGFATNPATGAQDFNDPTSWVAMRNPSQFLLDVQARYDLSHILHTKQRIELVGFIVNMLNNEDPTSFVDSWAARNNRFGLAAFRNAPFQAEIIVRVRNF